MFLKYMLPVFILVVSSLFAAYRYEHPACQEGVDSTVQNGWPGSFDVRIEKLPESCAFFAAVAGANYRISSKQTGENAWRQIATVHQDDPLDVPIDHVVVVNKDVAYVFWHNIYAVTTDRAQTWTIWRAEKTLLIGNVQRTGIRIGRISKKLTFEGMAPAQCIWTEMINLWI